MEGEIKFRNNFCYLGYPKTSSLEQSSVSTVQSTLPIIKFWF